MRKIIIACAMLAGAASPALASRHPQAARVRPTFIDAAATPAYPEEARRKASHRRAEGRRRVAGRRAARRQPRRREPLPAAPEAPREVPPGVVVAAAGALAAEAKAAGEMLGLPDGYEDGLAAPAPIFVGRRPSVIRGVLRIAGDVFRFVSGGAGWSIPYGDYPISPDSEGSWGKRHGALDLTGDDRGEMWDRQLGRHREGVEMHADVDGRTEGCVGVEDWKSAKRKILAMIAEQGHAYLHVWPRGVSITPRRNEAPVVYLASSVQPPRERAEPHRERRAEARRRRRYVGHRARRLARA